MKWVLLLLDSSAEFSINREQVDVHVADLKRQLAKMKSVLGS